MKNIKIAYIGGGSKQWARVFMNDLALCSDLTGEIGLFDIDKEAAVRNQQIGNNINKQPETVSRWNYVVYDSLKEVLCGADFVVISILPGTFEDMRVDVHYPEKYNIYQSVGDTAGPGGVSRALRTVPFYEEFAAAIEKYCPDAWVINFTNPMSICTKTLYDVFPSVKAFGCCHEVFHTQDFLCDILEEFTGIKAKRKEIYTEVAGINHFTWISSAKYKDIEIFEMDMYKCYGVLGAAGDRHLAEFMNNKWYLASPSQVDSWKFALTTVDFRIKQMNERIEESKKLASGEIKPEVKKSDEEAVELMRSVLGLTTTISNVNLPNRGQISWLPEGSIVETNAVFSNDRVVPVTTKPLPVAVQSLVRRCSDNIDILYEGIKKRDKKIIFESFVNQPLCSSLTLDEVRSLFDEMYEKNLRFFQKNN